MNEYRIHYYELDFVENSDGVEDHKKLRTYLHVECPNYTSQFFWKFERPSSYSKHLEVHMAIYTDSEFPRSDDLWAEKVPLFITKEPLNITYECLYQ